MPHRARCHCGLPATLVSIGRGGGELGLGPMAATLVCVACATSEAWPGLVPLALGPDLEEPTREAVAEGRPYARWPGPRRRR